MKRILAIPTVIHEKLAKFKGNPDDPIYLAAKKIVSDAGMETAWTKIRKSTEAELLSTKEEGKALRKARRSANDDLVDCDLEAYFDYVLMAYEDSFEVDTDWGRMSQSERDKWDAELEELETKLRRHLSRGPVPMKPEDSWQSAFQAASGRRRPQELRSPGEALAQRKLFVLLLSDHLDCHFAKVHIAAITCPTKTLFDGKATDSWVRRTLSGRRIPSRAPTFRAK
ncbi:hypothetical protein [Dokdonella sp.]|uniref:hypothetical protein n=1 Tax=Dokdonella sp. TaxID=2291710 RepID=UPI003528BF68